MCSEPITLTETYDIKNLDKKKIREALKTFFSHKKDVVSTLNPVQEEKNGKEPIQHKHVYTYKDDIEQFQDVQVRTEIIISDNDDTLASITVSIMHENLNKYDVEKYISGIYSYFSQFWMERGSARGQFKKYNIRVYQKILHDVGFQGKYKLKFLSGDILFKPLFNEKIKGCPVERIIAFDCPIEALTLAQARSQVINRVKQFTACLSPLLGIGFSDINSQYTHIIRKIDTVDDETACLVAELQQTAFMDQDFGEENILIIKDNMNGLQHFKDCKAQGYSPVAFFSATVENPQNGTSSHFVKNNPESYENLEKLLQERTIDDKNVNPNDLYCEQLCDDISVNTPIKIPRKIRRYYKKISDWSENYPEIYQHFLGSCTLYNMSYVYGFYEPTLMIAMMVASLEALAKIEKSEKKFQDFLKKYLKEAYDKEFCDFLYGTLRSGFFHSGATYFREYDCPLDVSLEGKYFDKKNNFRRASKLLRKAYISWIEQNMLAEENNPTKTANDDRSV